MSGARVFRRLFGVEHTVVEGVDLVCDGRLNEEVLVASVPHSPRTRCAVRFVSDAVRTGTRAMDGAVGARLIWAR